ncbi:MAG: hypothetical protein AB7O24_25465 [Kofleriaceae bacterium]
MSKSTNQIATDVQTIESAQLTAVIGGKAATRADYQFPKKPQPKKSEPAPACSAPVIKKDGLGDMVVPDDGGGGLQRDFLGDMVIPNR